MRGSFRIVNYRVFGFSGQNKVVKKGSCGAFLMSYAVFSATCPEIAPRWPQDGRNMVPRWPKMAPRWPKSGPKMAPGGPKMAPGGPKMAPGGPKMAPRGLKMAPR